METLNIVIDDAWVVLIGLSLWYVWLRYELYPCLVWADCALLN
jgi:hypothetical protein